MGTAMSDTSASAQTALSDKALADVIGSAGSQGSELLVVANGFTARLALRAGPTDVWVDVGRGDFGLKCGAAASQAATTGRLWWLEVAGSPAEIDLAGVGPTAAAPTTISAWLAEAESLTVETGRGSSPKAADLEELGYLAAWRCQFSGCGKDLKRHSATGIVGTFSYFAHIVAASAKGPRGDQLLSPERSADITNIMLMCDECHRRIDREDPDRFTVDVLRRMREANLAEVRRLLDSLQHQEAMPIVIMGNISAQSPRFVAREAEEAMWTRKLRMSHARADEYFYNGGHLHNPHVATYWGSLFTSLGEDIPLLRKLLRGGSAGVAARAPLAVFPLHGTSVLVLAGRVLGDASGVRLFQFNRDRAADLAGGKWAFDEDAPRPQDGKYFVRTLQEPKAGEREACLLVSLTYGIETSRLPPHCYDGSNLTMGTLEVTVAAGVHGHDVIKHTEDLDLIGVTIEQAIRRLQDEWRVERVHLFVGAPATACVKVGQKMQARHHAVYVCHETEPGPGGKPFFATVEISSTSAQEVFTGTSISLA